MYRLGLDIGGTKINAGIIEYSEGKAQVLAIRKLEVKKVGDVFGEIFDAVTDMCAETGIAYSEIASCGVGIPGTVSADRKKIIKVPNIAILSEDFAILLERKLDMPVFMLQDSRAAAWGEYLCGGGKGADTLICITIGTGIGTGVVINGKIFNGGLGSAGELGHVPVVEGGRPCGCGKNGCMEKYCAGGGLDITARELLGESNGSRELFAAARSGNTEAETAIDNAVLLLGRTVVSAVNLLSPNAVLFSGGMSEEEKFLGGVIEYVRTHCYSAGEIPFLGKAELGELSPMIGAALCDL